MRSFCAALFSLPDRKFVLGKMGYVGADGRTGVLNNRTTPPHPIAGGVLKTKKKGKKKIRGGGEQIG
jgi:hypothetical protein